MASRVFDRGLQQIARIASAISAAPTIQTMSVDDRSTAFVQGDTTLGNPTNEFDAAFDATPTLTGQTARHVMTIPAGTFNDIPIRRIALHNETPANVSPTSATLIAGIDGQNFTKSNFGLVITLDIVYTNA